MLDLDTSHSDAFLPIIREMGHDVACVFNGGTIYPEEYAGEFAAEYGIATVCETPEEMVGRVDAALIHSCNWDLHVARARPFIEADIPVLIDKPMVGNINDAKTFIAWAESGKVITGGSSLRYCREVRELRAKPKEELGEIHAAFTGCGIDEFNYGVHAYAQMVGIMGVGVESVRYLGTHLQDQYELTWKDGRRGIVTVGTTETWLPSYATVVTGKKVVQFEVDVTQIYRAFLEHDLPILEGKAEPTDMRDLLEPELAAIAGLASKRNGGMFVPLDTLDADSDGYDGDTFGKSYREKQLPKYLEAKEKQQENRPRNIGAETSSRPSERG